MEKQVNETADNQDSTSETCEKEYKICAALPCDLGVAFTNEARKRAAEGDGKVKGSIGRAVEQALRLWLGEGEEEED